MSSAISYNKEPNSNSSMMLPQPIHDNLRLPPLSNSNVANEDSKPPSYISTINNIKISKANTSNVTPVIRQPPLVGNIQSPPFVDPVNPLCMWTWVNYVLSITVCYLW